MDAMTMSELFLILEPTLKPILIFYNAGTCDVHFKQIAEIQMNKDVALANKDSRFDVSDKILFAQIVGLYSVCLMEKQHPHMAWSAPISSCSALLLL